MQESTTSLSTEREPNSPPELTELQSLYDAGLYLQAWERGKLLGPIHSWPGVQGKILAARVAGQLGGGRFSDWAIRQCWREHPDDPLAHYYYAYSYWSRRGAYAAWRWLKTHPRLGDSADEELRSSWCCLWGEVAAMLRDFDTSERWIGEALLIAPASPWVKTSVARVFELQDRYEEALAAVRESLELRPWYRPSVAYLGHLLLLNDRDQEALEVLAEGNARLESPAICAQLYALQMELKKYDAAAESLQRFVELTVLKGRKFDQWLASQQAELAYYQGDYDRAIAEAEKSESEFHKLIAARLKDPEKRAAAAVTLPVGFVRQHQMTCAPATLSALSRFWNQPADHLQVAEEICYDGSSNYSERHWAETNGWEVREFTVTEEVTQQLIDRGVPFTFTTIEPSSGHLQAIIGYDARRGSLIIRDPFWRHSGEGLAEKVLTRYRPYGPRGMALVPAAERARYDGIEFPDHGVWNRLHEIDAALVKHQRETAVEVCQRLQEEAAGHRLAIEGKRRLAVYDRNPGAQLAAVEQLLSEFPECQSMRLEQISLQRFQVERKVRLETYRDLCQKKETHPIFWQFYAQELLNDAREHEEATLLLKKSLKRWPTEARAYFMLGNIYWDCRRFEEALELYRFAACLNDKDEQFATTYFNAARSFKQTEQVLTFLRDRFRRFGKKSWLPARTLVQAYLQLDRSHDALQLLEEALRLRPTDGELLLYAADTYRSLGSMHAPQGAELLARAKDISPPADWLRSCARSEDYAGNLAAALKLWQQVSDLQPMSMEAHQQLARLTAETVGREAALEYLTNQLQRFPHFHPLHELRVEWSREFPDDVRLPIVEEAVAANPESAWMHRELSLLYATSKRYEDAWRESQVASELDPLNPATSFLRGQLHRFQGDFSAAADAYRQTIALSVDADYALSAWIDICHTREERKQVLEYVQTQLESQVIFGDSLFSFRDLARGVFDSEEVLQKLLQAHNQRPDLWHTWSVVIAQYITCDRLDSAEEIARQATERFPLLPRLWLDRSRVARAQRNTEEELAALRTAYEVSPNWNTAIRAYADALQRQGNFQQARELLENALTRLPTDPTVGHGLASVLWRLDEQEAAIERAQQVVLLEPGYEDAWDSLREWSAEMQRPELALNAARELVKRRPGEARSWLVLARALRAPEQLDERLTAFEQAIHHNPLLIDAHEMYALSLSQAGRHEEALAACRPASFGEHFPPELRMAAASIKAEQGENEAAIALLEALLADEPNYFRAWCRIADWYRDAGNSAGYLTAAESMVRLSPYYEMSLAYLAEARLMNDDRAGALEAITKAFEINPAYEFSGNMLFDLQMEANDLAGAKETLAVLKVQSDSPFVLAREVKLAALANDSAVAERAFREMRSSTGTNDWMYRASVEAMLQAGWREMAERLLQEQWDADQKLGERGETPPSFDGWGILWEDDQQRGNRDGCLDLAKRLTTLCPQHGIAFGYLGDSYVQHEDYPAAKKSFAHALSLIPSYEFAACRLFDLQMRDNEHQAAGETIRQALEHSQGPRLRSREVCYATSAFEPRRASEALATLLADSKATDSDLERAFDAFESATMHTQLRTCLEQVIDQPDVQPAVVARWAADHPLDLISRKLESLVQTQQSGPAAVYALIHLWIRRNSMTTFQAFQRRNQTWLAQNDFCWGSVGYGMSAFRMYGAAAAWMHDWESRPQAEIWMLVNAVEGFRAKGNVAEAQKISRHALTLPAKPPTSIHQLWLAIDAASDGQIDEAKALMQATGTDEFDDDYMFLWLILQAIFAVADAAPRDRLGALNEQYRLLGEYRAQYRLWDEEPARRKAYYNAGWRIAKLCNHWWGWVRYLWFAGN